MISFLTLMLGFVVFASTNTAEFSVQDQFENNQTIRLASKRTLLLIGDRAGLRQMPRWEEAFKTELSKNENPQEPLQIVRVAHFKGMPFFVPKNWARDEVKSTYPKSSVVCDWDGVLGEKYNYKEGFAAYLLDASGQVRGKITGDFAQERVKSFVQSNR